MRKEQRKQTIESDPGKYGSLLTGGDDTPSVLEKANKRPDIIQYVLVLVNELIAGKQRFSWTSLGDLTAARRHPSSREHHSTAAGPLQADPLPSQ